MSGLAGIGARPDHGLRVLIERDEKFRRAFDGEWVEAVNFFRAETLGCGTPSMAPIPNGHPSSAPGAGGDPRVVRSQFAASYARRRSGEPDLATERGWM